LGQFVNILRYRKFSEGWFSADYLHRGNILKRKKLFLILLILITPLAGLEAKVKTLRVALVQMESKMEILSLILVMLQNLSIKLLLKGLN
jgi:hypothetical protein